MKKILFLSALVAFVSYFSFAGVSICTAQSLPNWAKTGSDSKHPAAFYMTAVGEGDTGELADKMAMVRIGEQIRISIKSDVSTVQSYSTSGGGSSKFDKATSISIDTSVNINELEGLSVVERYYGEEMKTHYSLAVLDRTVAADNLEKKLREFFGSAENFYNAAEEHKGKQEIARAIFNYIRAIEEFKKGRLKEGILNTIAGEQRIEARAVTLPHMEGGLISVITNSRFEIVSGDGQKGEFGKALKEPLVVKAVYKEDGTEKMIKGLPLRFTIIEGKGTLQNEVITDDNGIAKSPVYRVEPSGVKNNIVEVRLAYPEVTLAQTGLNAQFSYLLPIKEDVTVAVKIKESNMGAVLNTPVVTPLLVNGLKEKGFNVTASEESEGKADYLVTGNINTTQKGKFGKITFAFTSGGVKIKDNKTDNVVSSLKIDQKATKGAGLSAEAAGLKSLEKAGESIKEQVAEELENIFNKS